MIEKKEIMIKGKVQGVCFRAFTLKAARSFDIKGTVKNLFNGDVQVIAIGEKMQMESFIRALQQGPRLARVKKVVVSELKNVRNYADFRIIY